MFGSVLSKLFSKGATNYGDDILRDVAAQKGDDIARGAVSKLGSVSKKSRLGDALVEASNTGLNAPLSLTRKGMREIGPDANSKIGMLRDRTGLESMNDLRRFAKELTGGKNSMLDEMTNAVRTNLGKGNNVDLTDLQSQLRDVRDGISDKLVRSEFDNKDPIALANYLRGAAKDIRRSATVTESASEKAKLLDNLGIEINKRIDDNVDPKYVKQMYDDAADEMLSRSREALLRGDKKISTAYKRLAKEYAVTPAEERAINAWRSAKKDFVDIQNMGKLSDQATGGGSFSRVVNQVPVVGPLADSLLSQPVEALSQKAGGAMRDLGRSFQSGKAQDVLRKGAIIGGGGLTLASLMGGRGGSSQSMGAGSIMSVPGSTPGGQASVMNSLMGVPQNEPTVGGYTRLELEDGYVAALMAGDAKAADAIGSILDIMNNNEKRTSDSGGSKKSDADQKRESAMNIINQLMTTYEAGGGGQGVLGGTLTNLMNTVTGGAYNENMAAYDQVSKGSLGAIVKAMGDSGQLSEGDQERALAALPKSTDTPGTAQKKLELLTSILKNAE